MKKERYEIPEMQFYAFDVEDVIKTSFIGEGSEDGDSSEYGLGLPY